MRSLISFGLAFSYFSPQFEILGSRFCISSKDYLSRESLTKRRTIILLIGMFINYVRLLGGGGLNYVTRPYIAFSRVLRYGGGLFSRYVINERYLENI